MITRVMVPMRREKVASQLCITVLGYLAVRYLRDMPGPAKVWTLAGLFAGVKCCKDAYDAYSIFL